MKDEWKREGKRESVKQGKCERDKEKGGKMGACSK